MPAHSNNGVSLTPAMTARSQAVVFQKKKVSWAITAPRGLLNGRTGSVGCSQITFVGKSGVPTFTTLTIRLILQLPGAMPAARDDLVVPEHASQSHLGMKKQSEMMQSRMQAS